MRFLELFPIPEISKVVLILVLPISIHWATMNYGFGLELNLWPTYIVLVLTGVLSVFFVIYFKNSLGKRLMLLYWSLILIKVLFALVYVYLKPVDYQILIHQLFLFTIIVFLEMALLSKTLRLA